MKIENFKVPEKLYKLEYYVEIENEYQNRWCEFFLNKEDLEKEKERFLKKNTREDGSYIPNITMIEFEEEEVTFEQAKCDLTLFQFENLFNVVIE